MKESQETPKSSSKKPYTGQGSIDVFAAQRNTCKKWRVIQFEEEFEEIRSKLSKEPFFCNKRSGVSCEDPADIEAILGTNYQGVSPTDFDFGSPKVMEDTIPVDVIKRGPGGSNKKLKPTKYGDK
ncbi:hypothetical protein M0R45_010941 [Rubus argutus]|uniref:CW-type domain-containing protein n=1 Tax=Rubus argutus TaxID=59490 RepID=A0AAW1Y8S6_RUBAR